MTSSDVIDLQVAVAEAVARVNSQPGCVNVRLRFGDGDPAVVDLVANAARLQGSAFEFVAGYETYSGNVEELAEIEVTAIRG